jgi:hypothetical protein
MGTAVGTTGEAAGVWREVLVAHNITSMTAVMSTGSGNSALVGEMTFKGFLIFVMHTRKAGRALAGDEPGLTFGLSGFEAHESSSAKQPITIIPVSQAKARGIIFIISSKRSGASRV